MGIKEFLITLVTLIFYIGGQLVSTQTVKIERILSGGFEGAPIFFSVATEDFDTRWR